MISECKIAFKEWAVVVNALAQGKQSVVLRKGGIHEKNGEFRVEHEDFLLFPTYEHQNPENLKPAFQEDLKWIARNRPAEDFVPIRYYAHAEKIFRISNERLLVKISHLHILSDAEIKKRFSYGKEKGIYLILARVFELPFPHMVSVTPQYAGCRSWVEFEAPLSIHSPAARVSDVSFAAIRKELDSIIK